MFEMITNKTQKSAIQCRSCGGYLVTTQQLKRKGITQGIIVQIYRKRSKRAMRQGVAVRIQEHVEHYFRQYHADS